MSARQYLARSPRYVFTTDDNSLVRFAPMQTKGLTQAALIQNLSDSGLSFTLPLATGSNRIPDEGTPLKVEFPVPGRSTVACYATVTRVEILQEYVPEYGDRDYYLIAVQFRHLPSLHLRAIRKGLEGKVVNENASASTLDLTELKRLHAFAFGGMTLALFASCYAMTVSASGWARYLSHYFAN